MARITYWNYGDSGYRDKADSVGYIDVPDRGARAKARQIAREKQQTVHIHYACGRTVAVKEWD